MAGQTNCESCANYIYDEESDCYCCEVDLDEDEMYRSEERRVGKEC